MTTIGQICLLIALVGSGYAAFACIAGARSGHRLVARSALWAAWLAVATLTATTALLARALLTHDLRFEYVTLYCDPLLPWQYSLAALWVGQAGSLLLWAWFVAILAIAYRIVAPKEPEGLRDNAMGILMGCLCLLVCVMVFGADPMQPSLVARTLGAGLVPSLQHPAMLVHPPIVFLGYAAWAVPFALAIAAMAHGRLDAAWVKQARPWALFAWAVLGGGILVGAYWAYEELGWGGYWSWDPIENGSLMPWLTGTALLHGLMCWKYRGIFKKTTLLLAVTTFGLCNFATFLTRSGIFSSLHAFSQSPIGWLFLAGMAIPTAGGVALLVWRRSDLVANAAIGGVWSRESAVLIATVAMLLLTIIILAGTLTVPLSAIFLTRRVIVGLGFYNYALIPVALVLLTAAAGAPLLRWGAAPANWQRRMLLLTAAAMALTMAVAWSAGVQHVLTMAAAGLAAGALTSMICALIADANARPSLWPLFRPMAALSAGRRQYAGFLAHLGIACLALGVTGSSLGSREYRATLAKGDTIECLGRHVRYLGLIRQDLPDKSTIAANLELSDGGAPRFTLLPSRHFHRLQNQSAAEVAIHSDWRGDIYTILEGGDDHEAVRMTFIEIPMMRWLWLGGGIGAAGALLALWPKRQPARRFPNAPSAEGMRASRPHRAAAGRSASGLLQ